MLVLQSDLQPGIYIPQPEGILVFMDNIPLPIIRLGSIASSKAQPQHIASYIAAERQFQANISKLGRFDCTECKRIFQVAVKFQFGF